MYNSYVKFNAFRQRKKLMKKFLKAALNYLKRLDKVLILLCFTASGFSILLLYSLAVNEVSPKVDFSDCKTQILAIALGVFAMLVVAGIDYRFISKMWFTYAPIALILVLLLFTGLGVGVEGADDVGWLEVAGFSLQPSELLKVAFIMTFSRHLYKDGKNINKLPHFLLFCVHGLAPVGIVSLQGDDGTALVFLCMFIVMMVIAGLSWKYILVGCVAIPTACYFAWNFIMQSHHKARFLVLFDETMQQNEINGIFHQQYWGRVALGSGGLTGEGLFGGEYVYVPEIQNDFIFSYIGNALGFVGCLFTIILLTAIVMKIFMNSVTAKDKLGKYICIGVFSMVLFHIAINIGMVLVVLPVIGIPLPFISAGGTSTLSLYISIGLVLSVYGHRERQYHLFYTEKE